MWEWLSGSNLEELLFFVCVSGYVNARMIRVMNIVRLKSCWLVKIFVARMGHRFKVRNQRRR